MEFKTCEEYVLTKLAEAEEKVTELEYKISWLEQEIITRDAEEENKENIVRDTRAGVYYWWSVAKQYEYGKLLEKYGWTKEDLQKCLEDFEKLKEFGNLEFSDSWRNRKVAELSSSSHCGVIKFNGATAVLTYNNTWTGERELSIWNIGKHYFLQEGLCENSMYNELEKEIKQYLNEHGEDE